MSNKRKIDCHAENCSKIASYNLPTEKKAKFCKSHSSDAMINVRTKSCIEPNCRKRPSFNIQTEKSGIYCQTHAKKGMINVVSKRCSVANCTKRPRFCLPPEKKAKFCKNHSTSSMVDVVIRKCIAANCNKYPYFNVFGKKTGIYCAQHRKQNMINVSVPRCKETNCQQYALYNVQSQKKGKYCKAHKQDGMINVTNNQKTCAHQGCPKFGAFNLPGETVGKYCKVHATDKMVNVTRRNCQELHCTKCARYNYSHLNPKYCKTHSAVGMVLIDSKNCKFASCHKRASYNTPDSKTAKYCQKHALNGMVNIHKNKRTCIEKDCKKWAGFNMPNKKSGLYCQTHAKPLMIDVTKKRCTDISGCSTRAWYGSPGMKPTHCAVHKQPGDISNPRRKCEFNQCQNTATHGVHSRPERCDEHKIPDLDRDLIVSRCNTCLEPKLVDQNGLCDDCGGMYQNSRLRRQRQVKYYIDQSKSDLIKKYESYDKAVLDTGCGRERPDFMWDFSTHKVILEVDEYQHNTRTRECELTRMINITQALGMPCLWVRYNPDDYQGGKTSIRDRHRLELLEATLLSTANMIPNNENDFLRVGYLFFDGFETDKPLIFEQINMYKDVKQT